MKTISKQNCTQALFGSKMGCGLGVVRKGNLGFFFYLATGDEVIIVATIPPSPYINWSNERCYESCIMKFISNVFMHIFMHSYLKQSYSRHYKVKQSNWEILFVDVITILL